MQSAPAGVSFKPVFDNTNAYIGRTFIFGGTIIDISYKETRCEIEVLQKHINQHGSVNDPDIPEGRLIIMTSKHLGPLIYKKGRRITCVGKLIAGRETLAVKQYFVIQSFRSNKYDCGIR